jgi:hypothetical protein
MQNESKKLIYKLAGGVAASETLQQLTKRALGKHPKAADRLEPLGESGSEVRFINSTRQHHGVTFGVFHKVTKGAAQYIIDMQAAGDEWKVSTITAKGEDRPNGEFVEGTLFFALWKNHVVLHQTSACRAEQLESYFSWLLSGGAAGGGGDGADVPLISLDDPVPASVRKDDDRPVKVISIASVLESKAVSGGSKAHAASFHFTPSGAVWDGIKAILGSMGIDVPAEIRLSDALEARDVRVKLELSCTSKKAESTAGEVMGKLGHALRHADGDFYTVKLTDGTIIKGKEMKVEKVVRVECVERLPVMESVFKSMMAFFEELIQNQTIIEQEGFGNIR